MLWGTGRGNPPHHTLPYPSLLGYPISKVWGGGVPHKAKEKSQPGYACPLASVYHSLAPCKERSRQLARGWEFKG